MTDPLSAITALTTGIELYGVHTYLGLKVLPFLWNGAKKWNGHGRPGRPYGAGPDTALRGRECLAWYYPITVIDSIIAASSWVCFACSATSPSSPTMRNPAPDSSLCRVLPDCVRFSCCSPLVSASAAAPGPDCGICFNCSPHLPPLPAAAPQLHLLDSSPCPGPNILRRVRGSVNKLKYKGRASLWSSPAPWTSHFRHSQTHRQTHVKILMYW